MVLFTKPGCPKCEDVKKHIPANAAGVTTYDITTAEGLAELAFYELVPEAEKTLPLAVRDGEVLYRALQIRKALQNYC